MIIDEILDFYETRPFLPIEIRQSDGRSYVIEHPEWMLIPPDRATLHFVTCDGRSRHLALHRSTSVAQMSPPRPPGKGKPRRK
jgi:hypothetical protein